MDKFFSDIAKAFLATPVGQRLSAAFERLNEADKTEDDDVFDGCEITREEVYPDFHPAHP